MNVQTSLEETPSGGGKLPSYGAMLFRCCAIVFCCYLGAYMRVPVVPLFARSRGADITQVGFINSAFLLMAGLLSLPLGILSDRVGRKLVAGLGAFIVSATSFLLCLSETPMQMVWIYLCFGVGLAAFGPTMMAIVVDFSPRTHRGRSYGWYTMALYTSMSLGPAVGGYAAQSQGFIFVFLVSGTVIFLTLLGLVFFLPSPGLILPHSPKEEEDRSAIAKELLKNRPLLGCWLATLGGCFGLGMFITFLPLHARNMRLSLGQIGLLFLVQGLCNALSRIPFGHLSDKVTTRADLVLIGSVGLSASMAGLGISQNLAQFVLFAVLLGVSMGLAFTSVGTLIADAVPAKSRGLAMGGYNTCIYLGMMLSAALMGGVIQRIGFAYGFSIAGLVNIFVAGFFYLLIKDFSDKGGSRFLEADRSART